MSAATEINATDLTQFQQDILLTLCRQGPSKGLAVMDGLEERYEEVNNGRLYGNLNELVDQGLVAKSQRDKRTNEYALTDAGHEFLHREAKRWASVVGVDTGQATTVVDLPGEWTPRKVHSLVDDLEPNAKLGQVASRLGVSRDRARAIVFHLDRYADCRDVGYSRGESA